MRQPDRPLLAPSRPTAMYFRLELSASRVSPSWRPVGRAKTHLRQSPLRASPSSRSARSRVATSALEAGLRDPARPLAQLLAEASGWNEWLALFGQAVERASAGQSNTRQR